MKVFYIDTANSGISGDMFLAALLDMVENPISIIEELKELKNYLSNITTLGINLIKVNRSGIKVNQLKVEIKENKNHRTPNALKNALNNFLNDKDYSTLGKQYANNVLETLFRAEANVHEELVEHIHLHELSSVDTLIDILGVTKALDQLGGLEGNCRIYCSKIPLGGGTIKSAHGTLPIPAPATLEIFKNSGLFVANGPIESELVTPTGAALLINLNPLIMEQPINMRLGKVVYSTGQKEFTNFLNVLRIFYGEDENVDINKLKNPLHQYTEEITVLETDVDDVTGELIGNFIDTISNEDILDVQITSSLTKKNRPSYIIKVLCYPEKSFELIEKIIYELGTLGVRFNTINRVCIDRRIEETEIQINEKNYKFRYKVSYIQTDEEQKIVNIKPEFDDLKWISIDSGIPVKKILTFAQEKINQIFKALESPEGYLSSK